MRWAGWLLVAIGVALRLSMLRFDVHAGYDFDWHLAYVRWFVAHPWTLPPRTLSPEVYHPPLYYWLAALGLRLGLPVARLGALSVACSVAALLLLRRALDRFVAVAEVRVWALALAAVLPASLHLAGMATAEALNNLLCLIALVLMARLFAPGTARRMPIALALGAVLGLALLTKISSVVVVVAAALGCAVQLGVTRDRRALGHGLVVLGTAALVSGWFFAANRARYGRPVLDAAECGDAWYASDIRDFRARPYLLRRGPAFLGWSNEILTAPYGPIAFGSEPQLLPALVASTFVDSYAYGFARAARDGEPFVRVARMKLRPAHVVVSVLSVCGGALIAWTTLAAWLVLAWRLRRRLEPLTLAALAIPLLALLGQLHYAFLFPPRTGPVKGLYMQFVAPVLCVLWAGAVEHLRRRGTLGRIAFAVELGAVAGVAAYAVYCRVVP